MVAMGDDDPKRISEAKRWYKAAKEVGNREEEAKWANVIGNLLKKKGEYVEALKWLRIDCEISFERLSPNHCFPSCQSIGEVFLLLKDFQNALFYQKKHLGLAKDTNDIVEQQRANTQLGRTYYDMLLSVKDDQHLVRSAKKYFKSAMELAQTLKENPPATNYSFVKEYIDSHNNMGMLEMELENFGEAEKFLTRGLQICEEEEVKEDDDSRTRLHHNLGFVYMELRKWDKAKGHMEKDVGICRRIGHRLGEAKGLMNLGVLYYKNHKYDEALKIYRIACNLAKQLEDEDLLVNEIDQNIESAKEAMIVMDEVKKEEQNLKKLTRDMSTAKGTPRERKCLLQLHAALDSLIEKATTINYWSKVREFGKRKKRIASELYDKEKLSDSFLTVGDAYYNLRKFGKASKWYMKSWETYKSIGHLEGQAMAKLNIGNALDSDGNWEEALAAFEESYRIAIEAKLPSRQLSALENMHYIHLIRFDNDDEARRLQVEINLLKQLKERELEKQDGKENCCSETDTEGSLRSLDDGFNACGSPETLVGIEEVDDDVPLTSLLKSSRSSPKIRPTCMGKEKISSNFSKVSPRGSSKSACNQEVVAGRKRLRVVLSDDEDAMCTEVQCSKSRTHSCPVEDVATSYETRHRSNTVGPACIFQDISAVPSNSAIRSHDPVNIEESSSSHKTSVPFVTTQNDQGFRSSSTNELDVSASKQYITIKIDEELIHVEADSLLATDKLSIEHVKIEVACFYYLQLPTEKRSKGFPIIQHIKWGDKVIESLETIKTLMDHMGKVLIEGSVDNWVQKRFIKVYVEGCKEVSQTPDIKLMKKLYDPEVSEDEVIVSDCELHDLSVTPLLKALDVYRTFVMLDLSHNLLGNETMEKLQHVFTSSGVKYSTLTLDLHCNQFGPSALYQICECPLLYTRLTVLNISGNRLTDACACYLSTILQNCRALYSLNIEGCFITSRTIQTVADALDSGSILEQLCIGHNNPISGDALISLLAKLTTLKRFSKLSLNGLKQKKPIINSLCELAKASCLSALMLGETGIGTEGALLVTESLFIGTEPESLKLDLSYCELTSEYILRLNADVSLISRISELNLAGNPIGQEGGNALSSLLSNPQCGLKVLVLEKCQLGVVGTLQILKALADNESLEDLNLANNVDVDQHSTPRRDVTTKDSEELLQPEIGVPKSSRKASVPEEVEPAQQGLVPENNDLDQLEVADSEEDPIGGEAAASGIDDSCASSSQRNSSSPEWQLAQEVSTAISKAKTLQLLDLSNNGLSTQVSEKLYTAWASSRPRPAYKHIKDQTIHLLTKGRKCCIKPCCRKCKLEV
ncbi:protein TONSOKU [Morus notabilis]|uniref:protein TONSOKU n=1 Tax=Morus notabilis TaxID=981085 RepID=UPI000CED1D66|nr:protein TONSOKU [Morus notabilis]